MFGSGFIKGNIAKGAFTYYVICRGGGGGFQKMTLDEGGYGQMTSSKIAQFRDFLYLKKLLAVSVYCDNVEI